MEWEFRRTKTVDAQIKLARRLERQSRNASAAMTLTTGRDGTVRFTGLRSGMYLVVQTGQLGKLQTTQRCSRS